MPPQSCALLEDKALLFSGTLRAWAFMGVCSYTVCIRRLWATPPTPRSLQTTHTPGLGCCPPAPCLQPATLPLLALPSVEIREQPPLVPEYFMLWRWKESR